MSGRSAQGRTCVQMHHPGKDCFDGGEIVINFAIGFFMTGYGSLNIANDSVSIYSIIYTIVSKESW